MKLLLIFLVRFAIVWCDTSSSGGCQSYNKTDKFLLQRCDNNRNCTSSNVSGVQPSDVLHVKLQGCDSSAIRDANERYERIEQLDISHAGLNSLGDLSKQFAHLTDFNASFNSLRVFPKEFVQKCPSLKNLDLSYNYLNRIHHGDFELTQQFHCIDLSHNVLEIIHPDAFANLSDLQEIRLNNNRLTAIPPLHFLNSGITVHLQENHLLSTFSCAPIAAMSPAVVVHLSWQYVTSFSGDQGCGAHKFHVHQNANATDPEGVSSSTNGGHWHLYCNDQSFRNLGKFAAGPMAFQNIHDILPLISATVLKLDLSGNDIGAFNQSIFERFRTLNELQLSNCKLTTFDISALNKNNQKYLNHLDLERNHLKLIENSWMLKYFSNLVKFNAGRNQLQNASEVIERLPSSVERLVMAHSNRVGNVSQTTFTRLTELKQLDLSDTQLAIDSFDVFQPLERLTDFRISENDLSRVNFSSLASLQPLRELRAAHCQIANTPDVIQYLGPHVEKLDLSGNSATTAFDSHAFERFGNLKELSLNDMGLRQIDAGIFERLTSLTQLDVSKNELVQIDVQRFPSTLEQLHLHANNLREIKHLNRTQFRALRVLSVSQNQLDCDYLDWLRAQFTDKIILIGHPAFNAFEQQNDTCHSNLLLKILLWSAAAFIVLLIIGCLCFLCRKRLCGQNH